MSDDTIFDDLGYIMTEKLADLTYEEVKKIINTEMVKIKKVITQKEIELKPLNFYLNALEYNSRTIWLLYKEDG